MLQAVLNTLFGCSHRKISFPLTAQRKSGSAVGRETYVVCLECGAEFGYDWQEMQIRGPLNMLTPTPDLRVPVVKLGEASGSACRL
jgi:hypothetical protein